MFLFKILQTNKMNKTCKPMFVNGSEAVRLYLNSRLEECKNIQNHITLVEEIAKVMKRNGLNHKHVIRYLNHCLDELEKIVNEVNTSIEMYRICVSQEKYNVYNPLDMDAGITISVRFE